MFDGWEGTTRKCDALQALQNVMHLHGIPYLGLIVDYGEEGQGSRILEEWSNMIGYKMGFTKWGLH
jgi:hypothetical protein